MKKENIMTASCKHEYKKPLCKVRSVESGSPLCNASVPDIEPGGDIDDLGSNSPAEIEKEGLWN